MAVFEASIWIVFRVLVSSVQLRHLNPWRSDFRLIALGKILGQETAGVLINALRQICDSFALTPK